MRIRRKFIGFTVLASLALALILVFNWPDPPAPVVEPVIDQSTYIPPPPTKAVESSVRFSDVTGASGIQYRHYTGATIDEKGKPSRYMPETMGPGVVLFDYDRDGDSDIFVANSTSFEPNPGEINQMSPRLFRNLGNMRFEDVTTPLGLNFISYGMGAASADYDGDTYPDLLLTGWGGLHLFRNIDGKRFQNVSSAILPKSAQEDAPDWSTSAVFFDADGDSDLDIYVANYVRWTPAADVYATQDGQSKSYATPNLYRGGSSRLLLLEDGVFKDRTAESGLLNDEGKSLGVALWDFNNDGRLDIVVANDTQPNFLYYNLGGGRFENRSLEAGIAYDANGRTRAGMGIDVGDLGNDGRVCIAIGNFSREPLSVFRDEGGGFFREHGEQSGVAQDTYMSLTFGLSFADFDLDGWQDLILANGHIEPEIERVEAEIKYRQPLQLLGNAGDGHFVNWSSSAGEIFAKPLVGRGLAVGDLDGDGDLDVVAAENGGALYLLQNETGDKKNFLRVKLAGAAPNTDAIGAKLRFTIKDGPVQSRVVKGGSSYLSQSEFTQTFGAGDSSAPGTLTVTWPSGKVSIFQIDQMNKTVLVNEVDERLVTL